MTSSPQLAHDFDGIMWVLDHAFALNTDLKETGDWELSLKKTPGASSIFANGTSKQTLTGNQKYLNCNGPHHLSLYPKDQDSTRVTLRK